MIHPSYVDLMNVVNKDVEEGDTPIINSRYSIVMATAKRARQIVDGDAPMIADAEGKKPLSIAVEELQEAQLKILPKSEEEIEALEAQELSKAKALEYESISGLVEAVNASEEDEDIEVSENDSEEDEELTEE